MTAGESSEQADEGAVEGPAAGAAGAAPAGRTLDPARWARRRRELMLATAVLIGWLLLTVLLGSLLFLHSSRVVLFAGHQTVVSPNLSGQIVVNTGPVLPDARIPTSQGLGLNLDLGKTEVDSVQELVQRYAFLASHPEGQIAVIHSAVNSMALAAVLRGAVLAAVPIALWLLLGKARREDLFAAVRSWRGALVTLVAVTMVGLLVVQPWRAPDARLKQQWIPLAEAAGVSLPKELTGVQVTSDATTSDVRRLVQSAVATYQQSKQWYAVATEEAADLPLRQPQRGDTVVLIVSDRHDNVGMDPVARAIGDAGGATAVFDAGDDTSTGSSWEAFSLDSLEEAFADYDRYLIAGNHDHGGFVVRYLHKLGWTHLEGKSITGPDDAVLWGVDDPRSSGLGAWRDETGTTFAETEEWVADRVCAAKTRISTVIVHDANLGREALNRGCVDLVVGGHTHVLRGPTKILGADGSMGYTFTNGTTGGAAYAIAVGSKPKREAVVTLLTYHDGRPVGLQPVTLQTDGTFTVGDYTELTYE